LRVFLMFLSHFLVSRCSVIPSSRFWIRGLEYFLFRIANPLETIADFYAARSVTGDGHCFLRKRTRNSCVKKVN
jgi:hypothetical protein